MVFPFFPAGAIGTIFLNNYRNLSPTEEQPDAMRRMAYATKAAPIRLAGDAVIFS
jgi:hypothetical protein